MVAGQRCPVKQMAFSVYVPGPDAIGLEFESSQATRWVGILELVRQQISRAVLIIAITHLPSSSYPSHTFSSNCHNSRTRFHYGSHLTDEDTEAQRGYESSC